MSAVIFVFLYNKELLNHNRVSTISLQAYATFFGVEEVLWFMGLQRVYNEWSDNSW